MAVIQIPAKSIVGKPKLNIANDNTYESIGYTKQYRYEDYAEIANVTISYCEQTPVSQSATVNEKETILYSGHLSEYTINTKDGEVFPLINNPNVRFLGQYQLSDVGDITPDIFNENLLLKIAIDKTQTNIDYKQIQFGFRTNRNRRTISIGSAIFYVDSPALMQNVTTEDDLTLITRNYVSFDTEQEALDYLLYDYVDAEAPALNRKIIRMSRAYDIVVVDRNNSFDLYFAINAFVQYNQERLDSIDIDNNVRIFAKKISSNSTNTNEDSKYSLPDNELLAEQTTYNGTSIYNQISNSIAGEYEKGKFSVDLTCLYMKYNGISFYDTVYTGKDGATISVGDIIVPLNTESPKAYGENLVLWNSAYAVNNNNVPYIFKVIKSELNTSDSKYITNNIKAVELSGNVVINADIYDSSLKIFVNGQEVDWYSTKKINAKIGDLLEFQYEDTFSHEIRIANAIGFDENRAIYFGNGIRAKFCVYNDGMTITLEY